MQRTVSPDIVRLIGNTPLLRVKLFERDFPRVEVYAKAEWFNPGGSVKDRAALSMIEDGERTGALTHRKTIIDSTSGNTGIAYALVGAAKGDNRERVRCGAMHEQGADQSKQCVSHTTSREIRSRAGASARSHSDDRTAQSTCLSGSEYSAHPDFGPLQFRLSEWIETMNAPLDPNLREALESEGKPKQ